MEEMFVIDAFQGSLAYDQTPRHPITTSVNTPKEIEDAFDAISYSKAASVLRMLKYLVIKNLFQLSLFAKNKINSKLCFNTNINAFI